MDVFDETVKRMQTSRGEVRICSPLRREKFVDVYLDPEFTNADIVPPEPLLHGKLLRQDTFLDTKSRLFDSEQM